MANEARILWIATVELGTVTNLESLADTNIWNSGKLDLTTTPTDTVLRISYTLVMAATPTDDDYYTFYAAHGDEHGTEIWPGGISETEGEISSAGPKVDVQNALIPVHTHVWNTNGSVTLKGSFDVYITSPDFQILIEANGHALTTGNVIHYREGSVQGQ